MSIVSQIWTHREIDVKPRGDLRNAYLVDEGCRLPLPKAWADEADWLYERSRQVLGGAHVPSLFKSDEMKAHLGVDITDILQFVSTCSQSTKVDILNSRVEAQNLKRPYWVNVAIYRLLCFRRPELSLTDGCRTSTVVEESLRLGLLLYLAEIWRFCKQWP